jgi:hypothetical protein
MDLLNADRSTNRADISAHNSIRLVSKISSDTTRRGGSQALVVLGIVSAFAGGFVVSSYWRPANLVAEPKIQIADFRVELPEGDTTVVITSREGNGKELGRLQLKRVGNVVTGVPEAQRQIAPRQVLSSDDAAFFRRELEGTVLLSA